MTKRRHQIDQNHPIYSLSVLMGLDNKGQTDLKVSTGNKYTAYGVNDSVGSEIEIPADIKARIGDINGLYLFRLESYIEIDDKDRRVRRPSIYRRTWPTKWDYLDEEIRNYLESVGIAIETESQFLFCNCNLGEFEQFLYPDTKIDRFYNGWIDIGFHDFLIQTELRRYETQRKQLEGYIKSYSSNVNSGVHIGLIHAWTYLENCILRIAAFWERLTKYALPAYFGLQPSGNQKRKGESKEGPSLDSIYDNEIPKKMGENKKQFYLFNKFLDIRNAYRKNNYQVRDMRNDLMHEMLPRPAEAIPLSNPDQNKSHTLDELHQLIITDYDKLREALLLFAGIIRSKTPKNQPIS